MTDFSDGIAKFTQLDECKNLTDTINKEYSEFNRLIGMAKAPLGTATQSLGELALGGNEGLSDVTGPINDGKNQTDVAEDAINNTKDAAIAGQGLGDVQVSDLQECLGIDLADINLPDMSDLNDVGSGLKDITDSVLGDVIGAVEDALSFVEKQIADSLSAVLGMIPLSMIDKLLNTLNCVSGCDNVNPDDVAKLPTMTQIEEKLGSIGLDVDGKLDWTSDKFKDLGLTDEMKSNVEEVQTFKQESTDKLNKVTDLSVITDETGDIPEIPKLSNKLEGFSLADKIKELF